MKLVIFGSRDCTELRHAYRGLALLHDVFGSEDPITAIISGCARGADTVGKELAIQEHIPVELYPADWETHGKTAGFIRNAAMANLADVGLGLWDGESRGTKHMMNTMLALGKPVFVYEYRNDKSYGCPPIQPVKLSRATIGERPGLDITVKSSVGRARAFAPTWNMVMQHHAHEISSSQYIASYHAILNALTSWEWKWLTAQRRAGSLCLTCYCDNWTVDGAPKFCHTHVLIDYLLRRWPDYFSDDRKSFLP